MKQMCTSLGRPANFSNLAFRACEAYLKADEVWIEGGGHEQIFGGETHRSSAVMICILRDSLERKKSSKQGESVALVAAIRMEPILRPTSCRDSSLACKGSLGL